jgi:transglutaminase-like putative cysteine protease
MFSVRVRASPSRTLANEKLSVTPSLPGEWIVTKDDNGFDRFQTTQACTVKLDYTVDADVGIRTLDPSLLRRTSPAQLNPHVVPYLFPSRYCQSDQLARFAWKKFGGIQGAYNQAIAINAWIHDNIEYLPGVSRSVTSAYDTVTERAGVCRDFAHLGIAF